ncbi:MAG: metallophosphoesterase, partial [Candidatus Thermoplasmatota archaeon]|nr:metallophosphoesterase [Candidatus Thermoplasmatota archaeon]
EEVTADGNMRHIQLMIPEGVPSALYDLSLGVGGNYWCNANALMVHDRTDGNLFFVHITDIHISAFNDIYRENYGRGVDEMNFLNPHFVIITGDITDNGMTEEFETFMRETMRFRVPVYVSPGNHDWLTTHGGGIDEYQRIVNPELDYAFDYGNVIRFYCMDDGPHNGLIQNIGFTNEQLKWLEEDLNRTGQLYHNRMLMNHGPWYDNLFPNAMGREEMLRIANVHNISWVFNGHTHYDRVHDGNGTRQTGYAAHPDHMVKPVFVQTATFSKDRWYVESGRYRVLEMRHGRIVNYTSDPDGDGNRHAERSWKVDSLKVEMTGGNGISMDANVKIMSAMCMNKTRFSMTMNMPVLENSRYQIYPSNRFSIVSVFPVSDAVEILLIEGMLDANNRQQLEIRIDILD